MCGSQKYCGTSLYMFDCMPVGGHSGAVVVYDGATGPVRSA
nr:MAG TPA: hypothetical protein [Caudoviricetes sp.]